MQGATGSLHGCRQRSSMQLTRIWSLINSTYLPFFDIARGQAQNPKHNGFIFHNLYFSPKPCRRRILICSPRSCRRCMFAYFGNLSPKHYFLDVQLAGQTLWILEKTPFDNIGCSSSFSRSTTRGSMVNLTI